MTHFLQRCFPLAALGALAVACAPLPPPSAPPASAAAPASVPVRAPAPAAKPPAAPAPAPAHAGPLLNIDASHSLIAVTVRRGGILARLGHDHVVASHTVSGTVSPSQNCADFQFRVDQLTVDEASLRAIAGLEKQPSADAIEGTRHNMLAKVLEADRYPLVTIHAERAAQGRPLQAAITLHGVTRRMAVPAELHEENGAITARGTIRLKQTDFGITPFSVMAGAMAVQDELEIRFDLVAR